MGKFFLMYTKLITFTLLIAAFIACANDHRRAKFIRVPLNETIDSMVVFKSKRIMKVYHHHKFIKSYVISLGANPIGTKQVQGDMKTPEGLYTINDRNPNSTYHKNLGISFPNKLDKAVAKRLGKSPGGDIKIHGLPNNIKAGQEDEYLNSDWTWG